MLFKSSRRKNLLIFFPSLLASNFAFELFQNAVSFHVFNITGSAFKFAMIYVLEALPKILFLQIAGLLADRFERKEIFRIPELLQACFLLTVFLYSFLQKPDISFYFVIVFIFGLLRAFAGPINKAIIPVVVKKSDLLKANSFDISFDKLARTLAPVFSLLIFAKLGFNLSVLTCSLIYLIVVILKGLVVFKRPKEAIISETMSIKESVKEGIRVLTKNRSLMFLSLNAAVTQMIFHPFFYNFVPNILKKLSPENSKISYYYLKKLVEFLGNQIEDVYMTLYALISLGGVIGVLASVAIINSTRRQIDEKTGLNISVIIIAFASLTILFSTTFFVFSRSDATYLAIILFISNLVMFLGLNMYTIFYTIFYQKLLPKEVLGRFIANIMMFFIFFKILGHMTYGFLLEKGLFLGLMLFALGTLAKILLHLRFINLFKEE